jgi:peroxiredoxin
MKNSIKAIGIIVMLFLGVMTVNGQAVGNTAPNFTYKDMDGQDVSLSTYRGKVVFLYFFGSFCTICRGSGSKTESLVNAVYGGRSDFQSLGLDTWNGNLSQMQGFRTATGLKYPMLLNASSELSSYATTYDRVMVIDQMGVLRYKGTTPVSSGLTAAIAVIDELLTIASSGDLEGVFVEGLESVFPNPAIDHIKIRFALKNESLVSIRIINSLGQELSGILRETYSAGTHTREISTKDLPSGLYFIRMDTRDKYFTRKLLVKK